MDDDIRYYLDTRFTALDHRLDELDAKIDDIGPKALSAAMDASYSKERLDRHIEDDREARANCRIVIEECRTASAASVDNKITAAISEVKSEIQAGKGDTLWKIILAAGVVITGMAAVIWEIIKGGGL